MTFGRKEDLLALARWKQKNNPGKYVDHIYGEKEVGGTSWLYLAAEPFESSVSRNWALRRRPA